VPPSIVAARAAYRRWYAAAGPWVGYFRAVPLVGLARGAVAADALAPSRPDDSAGPCSGDPDAAALAAELRMAGAAERWLGRPDVLLLLDLPGLMSVATVAALAPDRVRPVLVVFLWPEPGALLPGAPLTAALLAHAPPPARGRRATAPAQYAFVLAHERAAPAAPADLVAHFDNRYDLGAVDLPSPARVRAAGIVGVVACRLAAEPPAPDLADYLDSLEADLLPIRRLVLGAG
jgi:hypothetical protein